MRNLIALALLAFSLAVAAPAQAVDPAKIDRLMEIFRVRQMSEQVVAQLFSSESAQAMEKERRECIAGVFTADELVREMRTHYVALFTDEALADGAIDFFSHHTGQKLLEAIFAGGPKVEAAEVMKQFSAEELKELEVFASTPAGQLYSSMNVRLKPLQEASVQRLVSKTSQVCHLTPNEPAPAKN